MDSTDSTPRNDETLTLNGKQLAEVLDVAPPSLSEAVRKGYRCSGYPVGDWAIQSESGRIKAYHVPAHLLSEELLSEHERSNPERDSIEALTTITNTKRKRTPKHVAPENTPANPLGGVTNTTYSLLPEGQNYAHPVGMVALATTLKTAITEDTPQSRAVIGSLLAMLGAFTGHAVSDHSSGAAVGAAAGLAVAFGAYRYLSPNPTAIPQAFPLVQPTSTSGNSKRAQKRTSSEFLPY